MLENYPPDVVYGVGFALVSLLVVARFYAGEHWFNDRARFWNPIRRTAIPLLHRLFQRSDEDLYAETEVGKDERVAVIPMPPRLVLKDLAAEGYQPQPLASLARDWMGRTEVASWARYEGPKPFPGAPEWLRPRQIHVRLFDAHSLAGMDGSPATIVTAHEEATSWRPDQWRDHYTGRTLDVDLGRAIVAEDLGIALEMTTSTTGGQDAS